MMKKIALTAALAAFLMATPAMANTHDKDGKRGHPLMMMDTNKDGAISRAEFDAHSNDKFAKMDKNKDGTISKDEIDAMKAEWKEKKAEWKAKHKDGKVSKDGKYVGEAADGSMLDTPAGGTSVEKSQIRME